MIPENDWNLLAVVDDSWQIHSDKPCRFSVKPQAIYMDKFQVGFWVALTILVSWILKCTQKRLELYWDTEANKWAHIGFGRTLLRTLHTYVSLACIHIHSYLHSFVFQYMKTDITQVRSEDKVDASCAGVYLGHRVVEENVDTWIAWVSLEMF